MNNTNEFFNALVATGPNEQYADKLMLFGQFVGEWDFDWRNVDGNGNERKVKGEWIFSWTLQGNAVQDLFICPSREYNKLNPQPDAEYGTTIRIYNPQKDAWDIFYGCKGEATLLEAKSEDSKIVLTCLNAPDFQMKWVFSDITHDSFHWQCISSSDEGATWNVWGELLAHRKK